MGSSVRVQGLASLGAEVLCSLLQEARSSGGRAWSRQCACLSSGRSVLKDLAGIFYLITFSK